MRNTPGAPGRCVALAAAFLLVLMVGCGGGGGDATGTGGGPPVATSMVASSSQNISGTVGQSVAEKPAVTVRDQRSSPMGGVTVTFTVGTGSGTATEATVTTNSSGVATVGSWTLGTAAGSQTIVATSGSLAAVTFTATAAPDAPAVVEKVTNTDNQSATVNTSVALAPSVVVKDQHGNPVPGVAVTFAVATGNGTINGGSATTNAQGIATVGNWTLGSLGENTLTATVAGVAPATFTATGLEASPVSVDAISPATLTPGVTMTITGAGFSATPGSNTVTIDGSAGTVTAASATQLTVTVPANFACEPTREVAVTVTVAGNQGSKQHPLRVATVRNLSAGQSVVLNTPAQARCNELPNNGGRYMVGVYNSNDVHSPTGAGFQLRGAVSGVAASPVVVAGPAQSRKTVTARTSVSAGFAEPRDRGTSAHTRVMEENIEILRRNRHLLPQRGDARFSQEMVSAQNVGDLVQVKIPKAWRSGFCNSFHQITARVAYVGTRSVILEDQNNPLAGQIDTTYASIGQEFDNTMFGILEQYFGNPLAMDGQLSNTGKVNMVFSRVVNDSFPGIAGYVVSCDFINPSQTNFASSNFGQYFYARAATVAGNIQENTNNPPRWRWTMRSTIHHEVKHITAFAERISRNFSIEVFWLEEALARLAEEMYERHRYSFAQRENRGWGQSTNVGPYCGVNIIQSPQCALQTDQPRGFTRTFEDLAEPATACPTCGGFFAQPHQRSPIGRLDASDFSFYSTGWALSRWMIDHSTTPEATFIKSLIQSNLTGLINLETAAGRTWADMQPEWTMAMALDDRPNFAPANARLTFPSWNLRDIFAGLSSVFNQSFPNPWPLAQSEVGFGPFTVNGSIVPGSAAFAEILGVQSAPQLLELRAGPGVPAPTELRMVIVRVQ